MLNEKYTYKINEEEDINFLKSLIQHKNLIKKPENYFGIQIIIINEHYQKLFSLITLIR